MGDANSGRKEGMLVKKRKRRYKTLIWSVFSVAAAALLGGWLFYTWEKIPASIRIKAGSEQELSLNVPVMGEIYSPYREKEEVIPGKFEQTGDGYGKPDAGIYDGCEAVWSNSFLKR